MVCMKTLAFEIKFTQTILIDKMEFIEGNAI